jgi:PAS domain S-box-containing protein
MGIEEAPKTQSVEKEVRDFERQFRVLVKNSPDVIMILDRKGTITFINYTLPEYTVESVTGTNVTDYLSPEDGQRYLQALDEVFNTAEPRSLDVSAAGPTWWHVRLIPLKQDGKLESAMVIATNITERKQSEMSLRETQRKFETLIGNLPGMVYRCKNDKDWTMEYVSEGCLQLTGYHESDLTDHKTVSFGDLVHPEDQEWLWERCQASIAAKQPCKNEYRIITAKGETKWIWDQAQGIYSNDGELLTIEGFITDITERKQAEESIKRLGLQNRLILESAGEGIYGLDLNGNTTFINPAVAKMIRWKMEELVGKPMHAILHHSKSDGSPYPREECPIYAAFNDGAVHRVDNEVFWRKDGTSFPVEYTSTPIRDEQGKLTGAVVTFRDITERKRTEGRIRFQAQLLDNVRESVVATDLEGHVIYWGKGAQALYGYHEEEVLGRPITFVNVPGDEKEELKRMQQVQETGMWAGQYIQRRKDESKFWADTIISLVEDDDEKPCGFIGIDRDVTDSKKAGDALLESERKYRTLFEDSRDVIYISTRDGKILAVNKISSDLFGYSSHEMIGMNIQKLYIHAQDRKRFQKDIEKRGSVKDYEVRFQKKDGTQIDCLLTSTVRKDDNGHIMGYQGIVRDISERKRYEEELIQSRERLRKLSAYLQTVRENERTRIAREIHDELGQSLTGLKMDLSSLERSLRSGTEKNKDRNSFLFKLNSMSKLIDSTIQSVRRISTELRPGVLDDLGLIAAIEWQAHEFQHRTGIHCKINSIPKTIAVDQERATAIFRIFQETLTNVARHAKATRVTINIKKLDRHVVLKIHDNGKGITKTKILDAKSLGLLGMKERSHLFGGDVEFKGIRGKGTTVAVSIPLQ